jgi:hypothetical protein
MPYKNPMPATDSARDLHHLVGDDITADFETDPKFVDNNPAAEASSETLALRDTDDEEESDDELEDEDDEDDDDEEDDEEDEDDDEDEDDVDPEAEDDDEEEDEDEDDEDEVGSSDPNRLILRRAA